VWATLIGELYTAVSCNYVVMLHVNHSVCKLFLLPSNIWHYLYTVTLSFLFLITHCTTFLWIQSKLGLKLLLSTSLHESKKCWQYFHNVHQAQQYTGSVSTWLAGNKVLGTANCSNSLWPFVSWHATPIPATQMLLHNQSIYISFPNGT